MRRAALTLAAVAVLASAACSHARKPTTWEPGAAGSPAPTVVATPTGGGTVPSTAKPVFTENPDGTVNRSAAPRPATDDSTLSAGGLGPYTIGATVQSLRSAKLITSVAPAQGCTGYTTAAGVSRYHSPELVFFKDRLLHLTVRSAAVATAKGVRIGTPQAKVKASYPDAKQLNDWSGAAAWLAMTGDYALLFGVRDGKVAVVQAGMAEPLQFRYTDNQGC
jgi:hypothetical protein